MKQKQWETYINHLQIIYEVTDRVCRDNPYEEYFQFPEEKEDFRHNIDSRMLHQLIRSVLKRLEKRDRLVIMHLFGFFDGICKKKKTVGKIFNISGNRIYQIEARAFRNLRRFFGCLPNELREIKTCLNIKEYIMQYDGKKFITIEVK